MSSAEADKAVTTEQGHRASFFRQSGWLMFANVAGGVLMWAVHVLSRKIGAKEYGTFGVFLAVAMCIPMIPLQTVLAHQTAQALATGRRRELSWTIRWFWVVTFVFWLVAVIAVALYHKQLLAKWQIEDQAAGLWVTVGTVLLALWLPIFWGVLQGAQNFLWLGWSMMSNGVGRLGVAVLAVYLLTSGYAAGMMVGVLIGMIVAGVLACWQTRELWMESPQPSDWRSLLREVVPPMLAFMAFQFLFTADTMFVKAYFSADEAGFYLSAGTLSRALMWLVGPLASVMFPRIVHSAAKAEKGGDLMGMVLLGTAILAVLGAVSLSILGPYVVQIVSGKQFVKVASSLLPWYASAMVPLAVANVLLNNLIARSAFKLVVPLCILAIAYGFALVAVLNRSHHLVSALQTLGLFNLALLLLCAWFTWRGKAEAPRTARA